MKHFIFLFLSITTCLTANSQVIPNGDLEEWQTVGGWFDSPTGWSTLNTQILVHAEPDPESCQGNLALRVNPLQATESAMGVAETTFPFTYVPSNIGFCVKTNIASDEFINDTCRVKISFWNQDNMVYEEVSTFTESLTEWTNVILPLNQIEPILTDCKITVEASFPGAGLGSGSLETWISVDDFQFEFVETIPNIEPPLEFTIYPNPSETGSFKISGNVQLGEVIILDLLGNKVKELEVNSTEQTVELNLCSGIYFVKSLGLTKRLVIR